MKYSELISFHPIEDVIQLKSADDANKERELVKSYVMSDAMAENLQAPVIDQLQMDEVVDNHGVLIVGNYGTGKSHLMSVLSAVAHDQDNLQYLQNKKFAEQMKPIAGKFEVLRIEIGGVTMSLRDILFGYIQDDFDARGIDFEVPDFSTVRDNKKLLSDMMLAFSEKYPDKGYLIVVDEFLSYLTSRNEREIVLDLEFLRAIGEMCSKSKLRIILGVQEKIFDNPRFSFVSDTLKHVSDRFTQLIITKEATAYVVSERVLKKNAEQKAWIRKHLEKFSSLYEGMSSRMDEFVDLYPIHPAYIDVFNKVYLIENRQILKNISLTIKDLFNQNVPEDAPGVVSFDTYWPAIKNNGLLKSDVAISKVVNASTQLEDIINRSFPKPAYKPLAIKIIYALSVHRLTTSSLDVQFGMTAENLKDDLCLYLTMPVQEPDFLLGIINQTLKDIMTTVSGQFIIHNDANNQYYIDVDKIIDYDEKIKQRAQLLSNDELNRYFYKVVYDCLEWDKKQYVPGFNIYEHDLNWASHRIFREGYLFMGIPEERSTAQPERDFYIHIMPPYSNKDGKIRDLKDEVYFYFKSTDDFKELLSQYSAANLQADISEGKDKDAYLGKASMLQRKLKRYLSENVNTCFDVRYRKEKHQLIEILKGQYRSDSTFNETVDLAASICLDDYFNDKYPEFPVFQTTITRKNMATNAAEAFAYFAGRKTQLGANMLKSFGILDGEKIKPEGSRYAAYYIDLIKKLPPQGVINYSDIFEPDGISMQRDKRFKIWFIFTPIIFLSLVYGGYAVITMKDGKQLTAANMDQIPKLSVSNLYEFKYLSRPAEISMAELKKLFEVLDLNPVLLDNPNTREKAVEDLLKKAQSLSNDAVLSRRKVQDGFELWGEPLVNGKLLSQMQSACDAIKEEFSNYSAKYNTPAKLNNFTHSMEEVETLEKQITLLQRIPEYLTFKTNCSDITSYLSSIEFIDLGHDFKTKIDRAKADFRKYRDQIAEGLSGEAAAQQVDAVMVPVKNEYIDIYLDEHKKKHLDIDEAKKRGEIQEGRALSNLKKLRSIEILTGAKLTDIENDLASLKVCYQLTPSEMQHSPVCPHCRYSLNDKAKNVHGQLEAIENRIDDLTQEWTKRLYETISDPLVLSQKEYLSKQQAAVIDQFIETKTLPDRVDDFFVSSMNALLKGFEPVVIDSDDLVAKLEAMPPMDADTFRSKIEELLKSYTSGKDKSKLRIVVKRKEN